MVQTRSNNHQTLHLTANQGAGDLIAQLTSAPIHENISNVVEILASEKTHFEATTGELRLTSEVGFLDDIAVLHGSDISFQDYSAYLQGISPGGHSQSQVDILLYQ